MSKPKVEHAAGNRIAVRFGPREDDVMHVDVVPGGIRIRGVHGGLAVVPEVTNAVRVVRVKDLNGTPWPAEKE